MVVVVGSLLGEAASIKGVIPTGGPWFWIGTQGWEYLDLGRLWQILLTIGMFFWVFILVRGLWSRLPEEHPGNLPYLFLYSAAVHPAFLRRRHGLRQERQLRRDGLLAVLGGSPLG